VQSFYWNASFEIGIPAIDAQHRRLVEMIDGLATTITEGGTLPEVTATIGELLGYASVHFSDEERILQTTALPDEEKQRHRAAHRAFVRKVRQIAKRDDLHRTETAEQILEFLTTWLVAHILGSDRRIALGEAADATFPMTPDDHLVDVSPVERVLIQALSETERRFRMVTDHAPALIWIAGRDGTRDFFNRTWLDFTGLGDVEASTVDWRDRVHPDDVAAYAALIDGLVQSPRPAQTEYRARRADGSWAHVLEKILPRHDAAGAFLGLIASGTDVTAIKRSEELLARANRELEREVMRRTAEIERLMLTDPLTGVGNRRFLVERLDTAIEQSGRTGRPLTLGFVDLDHFKAINDRHGHGVGDRVLARVGGTLRANLRESDVVARYGGEEFVVVFLDTSLTAAFGLAERLRAAVSRIRMDGLDGTVGVSIGLAEWRPGEAGCCVLSRADRALYRAKGLGRNRCLCDVDEVDAA
jgi:diguanylate cyclase (GGDEF)-like protein/hemerythrin-like metal-binding protein/PAS domain S-box-containing protein